MGVPGGTPPSEIGFVGLGRMGANMVERQPSQPTSRLPLMGARKASTPRPVSALDMTCAPICGA